MSIKCNDAISVNLHALVHFRAVWPALWLSGPKINHVPGVPQVRHTCLVWLPVVESFSPRDAMRKRGASRQSVSVCPSSHSCMNCSRMTVERGRIAVESQSNHSRVVVITAALATYVYLICYAQDSYVELDGSSRGRRRLPTVGSSCPAGGGDAGGGLDRPFAVRHLPELPPRRRRASLVGRRWRSSRSFVPFYEHLGGYAMYELRDFNRHPRWHDDQWRVPSVVTCRLHGNSVLTETKDGSVFVTMLWTSYSAMVSKRSTLFTFFISSAPSVSWTQEYFNNIMAHWSWSKYMYQKGFATQRI